MMPPESLSHETTTIQNTETKASILPGTALCKYGKSNGENKVPAPISQTVHLLWYITMGASLYTRDASPARHTADALVICIAYALIEVVY